MAWVAVDKDGTEMISDYTLYRNGYYKRYPKCSPDKCGKYPCVDCKTDENGKRYKLTTYSDPPKMNEEKAIELLSFWDNFEYDPDGNKIDFIVILPKGSIKKLIGRDLTWEDNPVELKADTVEKITIDVEDYCRYLSYANYIENWAGTIYKCPRCGALNPEGYNCMECGYMKLSYE